MGTVKGTTLKSSQPVERVSEGKRGKREGGKKKKKVERE